jgi:hypothetical protein
MMMRTFVPLMMFHLLVLLEVTSRYPESSKDPEIPSKEKYWQYQLHLLHQKEFIASPKMY